jgi:hypothetical protein
MPKFQVELVHEVVFIRTVVAETETEALNLVLEEAEKGLQFFDSIEIMYNFVEQVK